MVTTENTRDVGDQDPDATSTEPAVGAVVMVSAVDGEILEIVAPQSQP